MIYEFGKGIVQDYNKAVYWYIRAAKQGHPLAQYNSGRMHRQGKGTPHNDVMAHMYFIIAATNGEEEAVVKRTLSALRLAPEQIQKAEALANEWVKQEKLH